MKLYVLFKELKHFLANMNVVYSLSIKCQLKELSIDIVVLKVAKVNSFIEVLAFIL